MNAFELNKHPISQLIWFYGQNMQFPWGCELKSLIYTFGKEDSLVFLALLFFSWRQGVILLFALSGSLPIEDTSQLKHWVKFEAL